jgi:basic membrane protein A
MSSDNLYSPRKPRYAVVLFGPEGQGSFNESGLRGAHKAERPAMRSMCCGWPASRQQRAAEMSALCGGRYALILAHGGQGDGPVQILAERWPEQAFAVTQGSWAAPNVARYEVLQEQSAFLAGVLAGQWSKTGKVGHFRARKCRRVCVAARPMRTVSGAPASRGNSSPSSVVTSIPGWARTCVSAMVEQTDLDIVFAMLDGGRPGVTQACRAHGVAQIGNVLNWVERDPEVFVASAICDSGEALFRAVEDHAGACCRWVAIVPSALRSRVWCGWKWGAG